MSPPGARWQGVREGGEVVPFIARTVLVALALGAAALAGARVACAQTAGGCAPDMLGTDLARRTGTAACFLGKGAGESFIVRDTLIRSISVWRVVPPDSIPGSRVGFPTTQ